jgi:hypothetical protein
MAAAMLLTTLPDTQQSSQVQTLGYYDEWDNPDIFGPSGITVGPDDAFYPSYLEGDPQPFLTPTMYFQSGPAEQNYFAQVYAATAAPEQWKAIEQDAEGILSANQAPTPVAITETLPGKLPSGGSSKEGLRQAVQAVEGHSNVMALVSPSALYEFNNDPAVDHVGGPKTAQWIGVENASGQYVDPSPATIDAAVAAGGDEPLYALTHPVAGQPAYPLTYVDRLYAPATGLTQKKTEAIATMIRYLATAGQEYDAQYGDGRLPSNLVKEALDSANSLVRSNCTDPSETIVSSSDPGPYMPKLLAGSPGAQDIAAIGEMLNCDVAPPKAPVTTTTVSTSTSGALSGIGDQTQNPSSQFLSPSSATAFATGTTSGGSAGSLQVVPGRSRPGSKSGSSTSAPSTTVSGSSGPVSLSNLPLPIPFSGRSPYDRLAGLVLGAGLVLLLRRPLARLFNAITRS